MRKIISLWFAFGGLMLAVGCSGSGSNGVSSSGEPTLPTGGSFCQKYCARLYTCDRTNDEQTCTDLCLNNNAALMPKLRGEVVSLVSSCLEKKDCKTVLSGNAISACSAEATASVAPSAAATDFCAAHEVSAEKCKLQFSKADCLTRSKLYSDSALNSAKKCTEKACTAIPECIEAALGSIKVGTNSPDTSRDGDASKSKDKPELPDESADAGSGPTCPGVNPSTTCDVCLADSCCSELSACTNDPNCVQFYQCAKDCQSNECVSGCQSSYPDGASMFQSLESCGTSYCSSTCN